MKVLNGSMALLLAAGLALGCGGGGNAGGGSSGGAEQGATTAKDTLPPAVRAQLDSGNAAYRARDYEGANRHYRATVQAMPNLASGWFGVYMAESALGNKAAADSARTHMGSMGAAAEMHSMPHGMPAGTTDTAAGHDTT